MLFETYTPGEEKNRAHDALCAMMDGFDAGKSYADMMRLRIAGGAASVPAPPLVSGTPAPPNDFK